MNANAFYDRTSQIVDGVDGTPAATFAPDVSSGAVAMAAAAVKLAFPNCDPAAYTGCLDHTSNAPNDGRRWYFDLPGYGQVFWTSYPVTLLGDPTSDMKVAVPADACKSNPSAPLPAPPPFTVTSNYIQPCPCPLDL